MPASPPSAARRRRRTAATLLGCSGAALLAGQPWAILRADPAAALFPSEDVFRRLRLTTLICGRDNTAEACEEARTSADPLLDHPRLPASCKDALWNITQRATVAPQNSFARRDPIDEAAQDVWRFCRQQPVRSGGDDQDRGAPSEGGLRLIPAPRN
jgi:hypothetical protein